MTLRTRLTLLVAGAVALAVVAASSAAFLLARAEMRSVIDRSLVERIAIAPKIESLRRAMQGFGGLVQGGGPAGELFRSEQYVQVVFADGSVLVPGGQEVILPVDDADLEVASGSLGPIIRDVLVDGHHLRMVTGPAGPGQSVQYARSLAEVDQTLAQLAFVLLLVSIGGVALAGGLGMLVARSSLRPVSALTATAEHVATTQDLRARIDTDRRDEIGRLAASFNMMLEALDRSREQQQRLVADASHELRTPLTSLRTNLEVLARAKDLDADQRAEILDDVTFELRELSSLVEEMVELATDARAAEEPLTEVRLDEVVAEVVERAERRTGRTIEVTGSSGVITGRPGLLQRALSNLIDNAHKWSPDGEPIEVTVDGGRVEVRDHGPGISSDDLPHIFDRFYRATDARTMPGSGLGLSIVKEVVDGHGGRVFARNATGGGATVGFELPLQSEQAEVGSLRPADEKRPRLSP